jgi:hypothetical protein
MSEERRRLGDGIEIDRDLAEQEGVPEDLDAGAVGPYRFPDPRRRRVSGWMYAGMAVLMAVLSLSTPGYLLGAALMAALAVWHLLSGWRLGIEQEEALERAAKQVPFAVGHASAAVTFHGWRARPRWHVIVYSADDPPSSRGLVEFDGVTGESLGDAYVEAVPDS